MRAVAWMVLAVLLCGAAALAEDDEGPARLELRGAERRLEEFEAKVQRMRGQPFPLGHVEKEASRRIAALQEAHPDDQRVKELARENLESPVATVLNLAMEREKALR